MSVKQIVREIETGKEIEVFIVDARELIQSKEYEAVGEDNTIAIKATTPEPKNMDDNEDGTNLNALKVPELKALAESLGVEGFDGMNKKNLIYAIGKAQAKQKQEA